MNHIQHQTNILFLGDLSSFVDEHTIIRAFERFGPIVSVRVKRSSDGSNKPLCYGFIEFRDHVSAVTAQRVMNGCILEGRRLSVQWSTRRHSVDGATGRKSRVQVLVSFISPQICDQSNMVTEYTLRQNFERFGVLVDCVVKKSIFDSSGRQSGYGFLHFEENERGVEAALHMIDNVHQYTVNSITYDCYMSRSFRNYLQQRNYSSNTSVSAIDDNEFCSSLTVDMAFRTQSHSFQEHSHELITSNSHIPPCNAVHSKQSTVQDAAVVENRKIPPEGCPQQNRFLVDNISELDPERNSRDSVIYKGSEKSQVSDEHQTQQNSALQQHIEDPAELSKLMQSLSQD